MLINIFAGAVLLLLTIFAYWMHLEMEKEDKELMRLIEEGKIAGIRY